jgi:predicted nucleic acid-binding protein
VKWFVEEDSEKALKIRDKYINGEIKIIAPELITFEALNALHYKRLFSESEMKEISEALEAFSFDLYSIKGKYAEKIIEVAFKSNITVYDASYIALASIRNTCMYTADEKLVERLKEEYLKYVKDIRDI